MIAHRQDERKAGTGGAGPGDGLSYRIELVGEADGTAVERVLARASGATLARAIFRAAIEEHPGRRIKLRHAGQTIADSAD